MNVPFLRNVEEMLHPGPIGSPAGETPQRGWKRHVAIGLGCACAYGASMGTFGGFQGDRPWLLLFAALKVPLLLVITFVVCLPSYFVLNTLFGLRDDFSAVLQALAKTQAAMGILLLSLAPYTLFWYASSAHYNGAIFFNAMIFGTASLAAQWLLRREYRPLICRNPRHQLLLRIWLVLFAFVGVQTAWVLRPFIGQPGLPAQFFRDEAWGNAYVALAEKSRELLFP